VSGQAVAPDGAGSCRLDARRLAHQRQRAAQQRAAAAAASGPTKQARAIQQRCQARLAKLGFAEEEYLQDRYVTRGWTVRQLCAELGCKP
jgi:hypothetical protein